MRLKDLKPLEKNARFMKGAQFRQLVVNLKKDGVLTSVPLVHRDGDHLVIWSGNHRVQAAIQAGIVEADALEIVGEVTRERLVALQLSHNAIVGEDDPNVLKALYDEIAFAWKQYSGLTDEAFKLDELKTFALRVAPPSYEDMLIGFLPADAEVFKKWLDKAGKSKKAQRLVARYEDFSAFFDTLLKVKQVKGVINTALALRIMAELAAERLAQEETTATDAAA